LSACLGTVVEGVLPMPSYGVRWWHCAGRDGVVGVAVVHQLPYTVWAHCRRRGLHPGVRFFREKS
jgi:hypothetical protein